MIAVKGIFDGIKFIALEKFPKKKKYKVLITFLEEISEDEDLRNFSSQTNSFSFWENTKEDIYQDYISKQ